jgi:hypothetical protein
MRLRLHDFANMLDSGNVKDSFGRGYMKRLSVAVLVLREITVSINETLVRKEAR